MIAALFKHQGRRTSLMILISGIMIMLSLLLAACASGGSSTASTGSNIPSNSTTNTTSPTDLITPGVLTIGSNTTYPPQEFIDNTTNQPAGFDVDLITAIAQRMGLKPKIVSTKFDTILDDLSAKRFDIVISAITITPDRQKNVDFVPYLNAGESLLVQKGNPKNIQSTDDLCGLAVGVQDGTVEQGVLQSSSDNCLEQDKPEGIAVRKNDASMLNAIQTAYNQLKAAGTYQQLILKWGLASEQLSAVDRRLNDA